MNRRIEVSVNDAPAFDIYTTGFGQVVRVHPGWRCRGQWCVIHRPMPGPWSLWPTYWDSESYRMYRECDHRMMHPAAETPSWHECDGCPCVPPSSDTDVIDGEWSEGKELESGQG